MSVNRRGFVRSVPLLGVFTVSSDPLSAQPAPAVWPVPAPAPPWRDESFPSHNPYLVKEIVGAAHRDLARVKELVARHSALAKASWDWGYGDWESALGAASHTGNRAIAEFLIEHGAAPTIFSAAMLGQLEVVKAYAAAIPGVHLLRGPHGIPLAAHARAAGTAAAEVLSYLASLGTATPTVAATPLSADDRALLEGRYIFGNGPRDAFVVRRELNLWTIARVGAEPRGLVHLGNLEFHPVGAPSVRLIFRRTEATVTLTILDPDVVVTATRVA